jgi:hypothetical protein
MKIIGKGITLGGGSAVINITYHKGATLTCKNGNTVYNAPDTTGFCTFAVNRLGKWVITITKGEYTKTKEIEVTSHDDRLNIHVDFANIYGICRDDSTAHPRWIHTDLAVGKSAGYSDGTSDFDNIYPWAGITRSKVDMDDVMVRIPMFYYRRYRENGIEYIKIADDKAPDFKVHPAFIDDNGKVLGGIYVGAYTTSANDISQSGFTPHGNITRAAARSRAKSKGDGWRMLDIHADSAIQMLMLVEYADYDIQLRVGEGYTGSTSGIIKTGSCDNVPNLTGQPTVTGGKYDMVDVVWRGIEGYWGNALEFVDGLNVWRYQYYVGPKRSAYQDGNQSNYIEITDVRFANSNMTYGTIARHGLSAQFPHLFLPESFVPDDTDGTTHVTDGVEWTFDGWKVVARGGKYNNGSLAGPFSMNVTYTNTSSSSYTGYRLMYMSPDE